MQITNKTTNNRLINNKIAKNASWIIVSKIIQSILGLIISMLTARFLGPSGYGLINYAESIVSFVVPIMNLGFSSVLVQELTNYPEEEGKILGTAVLLSIFSSFVCISGVMVYTFLVDVNESITHLVIGLYSIMLVTQACELIQYWYQAKLLSKYMAIVSLIAYLVVSGYKITLLVFKADVFLFAISGSIDYGVIAFFLFIIYKRIGGQKFSFSGTVGKRMFAKSKHYIVSSLMVVIFAQTDRVMLKLMINDEAVGFYSAAIKCASLTAFVFGAIIDSFRPIIYESKKNGNEEKYERNIERLYCVIVYLAFLQSIIMTLFSKYIIWLLYGEQYEPSVLALQIVVWYTTFSYIGSIRNVWILGENKQKYLWIINLGGAILNIILNLVFITFWGIYGAALASLLTQIFTNIIMNIIVWPLRHNNVLLFKGLNPRIILDLFRNKES